MRNHDFTVILSEFGEINVRAWQHVDFWKERDEEEERKGKEKNCFPDVTLFGRYIFLLHFSLAGDAISADKSTHFDHAHGMWSWSLLGTTKLAKKSEQMLSRHKKQPRFRFWGSRDP